MSTDSQIVPGITSDVVKISYADLKLLTRIELPCFIGEPEKAFATMGGEETVCNTLKDSTNQLQFRFPADNVNRSSLVASSVNKNGILLRFRRPKQSLESQTASQPNKVECEVVGGVPRSLVFNNLADYQFIPATLDPASRNASSIGSAAILDTVPTSFCKEGVNKGVHRLLLHENLQKQQAVTKATIEPDSATKPRQQQNANFEDDVQMQETEILQQITEGQSRNPDKGLAYFINITDPVPLQHPRGDYPYDNERGIVMVRLLKKLFSIIPVLSREQIETYLNLEGRVHLFKSCLPYVAYSIVKGPYRQMWIRYGYDVKQHPESAIYQTIHFRVSPPVVKDVTERVGRKVGSAIGRDKLVDLDALRVASLPLNSVTYLLMNRPQEDAPIFVYNHVIKMQFVVQIYQLTDPAMVEYLHSTTLLSTFDPHTGWYPAETLNTLRVMALKVLPERINSFLSLPDSVIWEDFQQSKLGSAAASAASATVGASAASKSNSVVSRGYMINMDAAAIHEEAAEFGFNENSSGLFVIFNRTLNTLRAYLNDMQTTVDPDSIALTPQGAVPMDHLRTVDGIYLGKVLSWLKVYTTIMQDIVAATNAQHEFSTEMHTSLGGARPSARVSQLNQGGGEPAAKRARVAPQPRIAKAGAGSSKGGAVGVKGQHGHDQQGHAVDRGASAGSGMPLMRGVQAFELFEGSQEDSDGTSDSEDSRYN